jgi:hypothetical protein
MIHKKTKYNNKITELDGIKFHSRKESARYSQLKLYEKGGLISDLRLQVTYQLIEPMRINGKHHRAICYIADFVYYDTVHKCEVVEDVKGMITDIFRIKLRLMKQVHGIEIKIT